MKKSSLLISLLILTITLAFVSGANSNNHEGNINLLPGDPDFETGFNGWHAYTAPWVNVDLSNRNYKHRYTNQGLTRIDEGDAFTGKRSAKLTTRKDNRTYLTTSSVLNIPAGAYTFSTHIKCNEKTNAQLRITPTREIKGWSFYSSIDKKEFTVDKNWVKKSLTFMIKNNQTFIPTVDIFGAGKSCNVDSLMLVSGSETATAYMSPRPVISRIVAKGPFPTPMPSLFITERNKGIPILFDIDILQSNNTKKEYNVIVKLENTSGLIVNIGEIRDIKAISNYLVTSNFSHIFPDTGIWKIHLYVYENNAIVSKSTTVVATMVKHTGHIDSFFGAHQKFSPLTHLMGFGAIRDMHLLEWIDIQPEKDKWVLPDENELSEIKRFVDNGGMYLTTIVSESPKKKKWAEDNWGIKNYRNIPLWAGDTHDTSGGQSRYVTRTIKPEAIKSYVTGIVKKMPYLDLEVMNEPNHYMSPEEYLPILKTTYTTVKSISPETKVIGMANPPIWAHLSKGHKAKWYPKPYTWFEEVLNNGGGYYLDAISVHTYDRSNKDSSPEDAYGTNGQANWAIGLQSLAESKTKNKNIPVWVSEKGIASPSWRKSRLMKNTRQTRANNAITQAEWIVRSQIDMKAKGIKHFFIWNSPWGTAGNQRYFPLEDTNFTFYDTDGLPRPALIAQKVLIEHLSNTSHIASGEPISSLRYEIFKKEGFYIVILWTYHDQTSIKIQCLNIPSNSYITNLYGKREKYLCGKNSQLKINSSPIYIRLNNTYSIQKLIATLDNLKKI